MDVQQVLFAAFAPDPAALQLNNKVCSVVAEPSTTAPHLLQAEMKEVLCTFVAFKVCVRSVLVCRGVFGRVKSKVQQVAGGLSQLAQNPNLQRTAAAAAAVVVCKLSRL